MPLKAWIEAIREETHKDRIRSALLELGGLSASVLDNNELVFGLLRLSRHSDLLISLKALQILTRVFRHRNRAESEYYRILAESIRDNPNAKKTEQMLIFLQRLATIDYARHRVDPSLFQEDPIREEIAGNCELISAVLSVCCRKECKYQGLLLLWILTFSKRALRSLEKSPMFYMLSFVSRDCKEKELRLSLFIIRNYLTYTCRYSYSAFQKIEELLSVASNRGNKEDEEEQENLEFCRDRYLSLVRKMSTFDAYMEELQSGHLQPLPYHFSEEFWKNNLESLGSRRTEIVKCLKRYLKSEDSSNIWIASNDLYRMVEVCPDCVAIFRQLDIHQILFELLSCRSSEDVRFHVMEALSVCYTKE